MANEVVDGQRVTQIETAFNYSLFVSRTFALFVLFAVLF